MSGPSTATSPSKVGIFRNGFYWLLDVDGHLQRDTPQDQAFAFGGIAGDIPITGIRLDSRGRDEGFRHMIELSPSVGPFGQCR